MCRAIRVLHNFEPKTTEAEIRAAALQYVRKVSGMNKPSAADAEPFEQAVEAVAHATMHLLGVLHTHGEPRTREGEKEKARKRWAARAKDLGKH
ncbi:MAG TPA: DUF2277 domain-containing protein [bacterium]|nr:DUF2277 domain-containing protein [bacterium]